MTGFSITTASQLKCPHGGTVTIVSSNVRSKANGAPLALATDVFTIAGCPFQIPAVVPIPSPCITVQWIVTDMRSKTGKMATLSQSSVGLCLSAMQVPQGPVVITPVQSRVKSQ